MCFETLDGVDIASYSVRHARRLDLRELLVRILAQHDTCVPLEQLDRA